MASRFWLRGMGVFILVAAAGAQTIQHQPAGLETDWDIAAVLQAIGAHAGRLQTALEKLDVNSWLAKGASDTYLSQWQSSEEQAKAMAEGAQSLSRNPQQLSAALELFFRITAVETMLNSLEEGCRKYQSGFIAGSLASLAAENGSNRDRLQGYLVNLAAQREQELKVMDREAQRCRSVLTQVPPKPGRKK